jgi:hypothetical protein
MSFLSRGRGASSAARGAQLTRGRNLKGELVTQADIEEKMAEAKAAEAAEAERIAEATRMAAEEAAEAERMAAEAERMAAEEAERAAVREYIKTSGQRRLPLKIFENPDPVMSAPLVHAPSFAPFYDPRFDNPLYDSRYPNTMFADTTHFPDARVNPNILKKSQEINESKMGGARKKKKYTQTRQKKQQRRRRHRRHSTRKYKK